MKNKSFLYNKLYDYYKQLILSGKLPAGTRLPSIRRCSELQGMSKTTVEQAYMLLCDDGYLIPRSQSGYYVSDKAKTVVENSGAESAEVKEEKALSDYTSTGVDIEAFDLDIWSRYIKSALRHSERLMDYGEPQGEQGLRRRIAEYVKETRNCVCSENDIVIGAGVQTLLNILCPLVETNSKTVYFSDSGYRQGIAVFKSHGCKITDTSEKAHILYVSPSHMSAAGDIMEISDRHELVSTAKRNGQLIIEDDYDSEFRDLSKPTPSLQGLDSENVVYIGTFSKMLLPSIRISYMILPQKLLKRYARIKELYNQTVSIPDQLALEQFIADGRLSAQLRKAKKLYSQKSRLLSAELERVFGNDISVVKMPTPLYVKCVLNSSVSFSSAEKMLSQGERAVKIICVNESTEKLTLAFSVSSVPLQFIKGDVSRIRQCFCELNSKQNF